MRRILTLCLVSIFAACSDAAPPSDSPDSDSPDVSPDVSPDLPDAAPDVPVTPCQITAEVPDLLLDLSCTSDFDALASAPLDASIPAARSLKTVYDRVDGTLYFQNVHVYPTHYPFCRAHLSGNGRPPVADIGTFNSREYYSPSRRFILGSLTHYAGPDVYAFELAPYDTASSDMVDTVYRAIATHAALGDRLRFHPTSLAIERLTTSPDIARITTAELFAGIAYQPLNLSTSFGKLRFARAAELTSATPTQLDYRDIVVLDFVPNSISVVQGIITDQLQTPLAHINVLSQNRGTPNMALVGAWDNPTLRALDGAWVALTVGAFEWSIAEVTQAEADAWWDAHRPTPLGIPRRDDTRTTITAIDQLLGDAPLGAAIAAAIPAAIPAFGGKAAHYAALRRLDSIRVEAAFVIPIHWYSKHLTDAGLADDIATMLSDPAFRGDPHTRSARLAALRAAIIATPIDPAFLTEVTTRLADLPRSRARFRSSTNAEDLDGFTGAGLYTSETGDPNDPSDPVDVAIKTVWASVWSQRAFDEREYRGIDHTAVGMALLVTPSFPDEEANGVAITANLFDPSGLEPAFIINVQKGDTSVVLPPPGVTSDYFIYYYLYPGQPSTYLAHSNLAGDQPVLTAAQTFALGQGLAAIHAFFQGTYRRDGAFYGMDVEFKFDAPPGEAPLLWIKQARPHPGWGLGASTDYTETHWK